ncbi:class I SAM-dependent methyltransferase [Mesorhizobium sp. CA14]|uniref:class I SAM-dependent methyltransferase n=1 Tax=Mesorhizobium sp. CA14 TaxID=2876642 RepID=UPI001CCE335B|nr:class I SAM-dependent methyltransferase [Mesorhizobium sp. CA14]MBZ9847950.1 class I SAM-dependent methyltransferase [Mesorhizobium sp. CA14]
MPKQSTAASASSRPGDVLSRDYRLSHVAQGCGAKYIQTFQSGYYAALWEKVERPLVEEIFRSLGGPDRSCLDFACGTGRITSVAARFFGTVVGVDVSEPMLACAAPRDNVRLLLMDITKEPLRDSFDVVSAFRFFLNAEDSLRRQALLAIHEHLVEGGRIVCNIHANASSPAGVASRYLNSVLRRTKYNTISLDQMKELLVDAGFLVEKVIPYGFLPRPGRFAPGLCEALVAPAETVSRALRIPSRFAENFVVVATKPAALPNRLESARFK